MKNLSKLESWNIIESISVREEYIYYALIGRIYNDDRFEDGTLIRTSKIKEIDFDDMTAMTKNTMYKLGKKGEHNEKNNIF